jgi:NAD(P)-dependent dehydrogenase (short-subunit alcohol dehydrogenase family)
MNGMLDSLQSLCPLVPDKHSGVGYGIAETLLSDHYLNSGTSSSDSRITVVLACRNTSKATAAKDQLIEKFYKDDLEEGNSAVQIIECDLSDMTSVYKCSQEFKSRYV